MQEFSIKSVERLSGIKAHTIRIWEQRHGIVAPSRKESNHRFYTNDDLKVLLKIAYLYQSGLKIGSIAAMSLVEIDELVEQAKQNELNPALALLEMITHVINLDTTQFENQIDAIVKKYGFKEAMLQVLFPLLNRIGILWLTDKVLPGQEHFASNIITNKIFFATDQLIPGIVVQKGTVMMFAPEGEFHEIAMLFMRYLLLQQGNNVIYLGCNTPMQVVEAFYEIHKPSHLLVNLVSNLQNNTPVVLASSLTTLFPQAQVVLSGKVVRHEDLQIQGVRLLKTEAEMLDFATNIYGIAN